jgi:hypothetical protein
MKVLETKMPSGRVLYLTRIVFPKTLITLRHWLGATMVADHRGQQWVHHSCTSCGKRPQKHILMVVTCSEIGENSLPSCLLGYTCKKFLKLCVNLVISLRIICYSKARHWSFYLIWHQHCWFSSNNFALVFVCPKSNKILNPYKRVWKKK